MATGRIGVTPTLRTRWSKAPAGGTTSLSGLDDNSVSLVYDVGYEAVYRNGVLLSRGNDYTATDGTTVTLIDATIAGDIIEIFANELIPLSDAISKGQYTAKGALLSATAASTPGVLTVGSNDQVLTADSSTATGLKWAAPVAAGFVGVSLSNGTTTTQTISNATFTSLTFSTEDFDTDGFHSTSTNTSRITIPAGKGGKYQINFFGEYTTDSTSGNRFIYLAKNGTKIKRHAISRNNYGDITQANLQMTIDLVATDYIEIQTFQSSGGNLDFLTYDGSTSTETVHFSATYLGA